MVKFALTINRPYYRFLKSSHWNLSESFTANFNQSFISHLIFCNSFCITEGMHFTKTFFSYQFFFFFFSDQQMSLDFIIFVGCLVYIEKLWVQWQIGSEEVTGRKGPVDLSHIITNFIFNFRKSQNHAYAYLNKAK